MTPRLCACGCGEMTAVSKLTRSDRGLRKGDYQRYVIGHAGRQKWVKETVKGYRYAQGTKRTTLHRRRAERALGKPLPPGAEVHHADGTKRDDAPLVICQDRAYHMLLHKRMRERQHHLATRKVA